MFAAIFVSVTLSLSINSVSHRNILTQAQCSGQVILAVGIVATVAQLKARERAQRCKSEYSGTVVSSAGSSSGRRQKGHRGGSEPSYLSDGDGKPR